MNIVIVDYGMGNLNSVKRQFTRLRIDANITSKHSEILNADKVILPGVGHFENAMNNLRNLKLIDVLNEFALAKQKPILGICLGMQLMANQSEEGNSKGFGWFDADVVKFNVSDKLKYKIPHTGWNQIEIKKQSSLMKNIPENSEFYFVHSYHFKNKNSEDTLNTTFYDYTFTSAIEKNNISGVQYHPEKSHDIGGLLLKNFIEL